MKILALELSSGQRSVAVVQRGAAGGMLAVSEVVEAGAGPTRPLGMVAEALNQAQLERGQLEALAVGLGPGSYTGIRVAISLAQGWQLARNVKLVGLSTADVLAAQAQAEGARGRAGVVIDAQRGEFYLGLYELDGSGWRELEPLRLLSLAGVQAAAAAGAQLIGPEATRWFASARPLFPSAAQLGRLALDRTNFVPGEQLEPIYLRATAFVKAAPRRQVAE